MRGGSAGGSGAGACGGCGLPRARASNGRGGARFLIGSGLPGTCPPVSCTCCSLRSCGGLDLARFFLLPSATSLLKVAPVRVTSGSACTSTFLYACLFASNNSCVRNCWCGAACSCRCPLWALDDLSSSSAASAWSGGEPGEVLDSYLTL